MCSRSQASRSKLAWAQQQQGDSTCTSGKRLFFLLLSLWQAERSAQNQSNSTTLPPPPPLFTTLLHSLIINGAPWSEPRSPLAGTFTRGAGHAPAPTAGRALFAPILERAKPLGADRQGPAPAAELAAAGARAAAAVARGGGGLSLLSFFF